MKPYVTAITFSLFVTVVFWGCKSQLQKDQKQITELVKIAQRVKKQQTLLQWFYVTEGKEMDLAETYADYQELFSPATIQFIDRVLQQTTDKNKFKQFRYFENYLREEFLNMQTARFRDKIQRLEQSPIRLASSEEVTFARIYEKLSPTLSRTDYIRIFQSAAVTAEKIITLQDTISTIENLFARSLGYPSSIELIAAAHNFGPQQLYAVAGKFLENTDSIYSDLLNSFIDRELNISPNRVHLGHLYAIKENNQFDSIFTSQKLLPPVTDFLGGLGIRVNRQSYLTINSANLPEKQSAVFCAVIDVPTDVRISFKPTEGYSYSADLFRQMGFAQFALFNRSKSPVFQQLYESPVREVFGLFFEKVWEDTNRVNAALNLPEEKKLQFYRYLALNQLIELRLSAATIQFEIDRTGFDGEIAEHFRQLFSRALRISFSREEIAWLRTRVDNFFNAAVFLQGSILEAYLRNDVENKFGQSWYKEIGCGKYLKSLWSRGNDWSIPEFMKEMNSAELTPGLLINNIKLLVEQISYSE
jgi:hypothetical protein